MLHICYRVPLIVFRFVMPLLIESWAMLHKILSYLLSWSENNERHTVAVYVTVNPVFPANWVLQGGRVIQGTRRQFRSNKLNLFFQEVHFLISDICMYLSIYLFIVIFYCRYFLLDLQDFTNAIFLVFRHKFIDIITWIASSISTLTFKFKVSSLISILQRGTGLTGQQEQGLKCYCRAWTI